MSEECAQSLDLVRTCVPQLNLQKHMLAAEAVMRAVARRFEVDKGFVRGANRDQIRSSSTCAAKIDPAPGRD